MKLSAIYKRVLTTHKAHRDELVEMLKVQSYVNPSISDSLLRTISENLFDNSTLKKLYEMELSKEAPEEIPEELELDDEDETEEEPQEENAELAPEETEEPQEENAELAPEETEEPQEDTELDLSDAEDSTEEVAETGSEEENSELDALDASEEETTIEDDGDDELDLDNLNPENVTDETSSEETEESEEENNAGVGILSLIGEIQDKLANGNPSQVELAALKALPKMIKEEKEKSLKDYLDLTLQESAIGARGKTSAKEAELFLKGKHTALILALAKALAQKSDKETVANVMNRERADKVLIKTILSKL